MDCSSDNPIPNILRVYQGVPGEPMRTFNASRFMPKQLTPETLIKQDIKRYLSMRGYYHFPIRQGLGSKRGICDIIALKGGITYFLEIKSSKGRQSPYQVEFQYQIEQAGCRYLIARSVEDLIKAGV